MPFTRFQKQTHDIFGDESVDHQIIERLRQDGDQVLDVTELDPGISDDKVLSMANGSKAILLTSDRDFGDLVFRQRRLINGIVLIRLADCLPQKKQSCSLRHLINTQKRYSSHFPLSLPHQFVSVNSIYNV